MSFHIAVTLHVNGESLPENVTDALQHFSPMPRGARSRYGSGSPLTNILTLSEDLFGDLEGAMAAYDWTHVAGTYYVSPDNLLFSVKYA